MPQGFMPRGFGRNKRWRENALRVRLLKKAVDCDVATPGQVLVKTWEVKNTGTVAWPAGTILRPCRGTVGLEKTPFVTPAEPGVTVEISALIRAPLVFGTHRLAFRLSDVTGKKFGPRLKCDVEVRDSSSSSSASAFASSSSSSSSSSAASASEQPVAQVAAVQPPVAQPVIQPAVQPSAPPLPTPHAKYAGQLATLKSMGFDNPELNIYLLEQNSGNVDRVIHWWLDQIK